MSDHLLGLLPEGSHDSGAGTRFVASMNVVTLLRSPVPPAVGAEAGGTRPRPVLLWVCLAVVLVRATYVLQPLRSDEGGYLLAARQWHSSGEFLYGDYYVDRPPLLMLIFRVAALTDWDPMIRVLAIPFALLAVVAGWSAGQVLGGRTGAIWAAVTAGALMSTPALAADQADGELFAAALVLAALALALRAWEGRGPARLWHAVGAGVLAGAAPLVKQNFLEGLLFAGVLVAVALLRAGGDPVTRGRATSFAAAVATGAAVPYLLVWAWAASSGFSVATLWADLLGFRGAAFDVIWSAHSRAPLDRSLQLLALGLVSGLLLVVGAWFAAARPWRSATGPVGWAVTAVLGYGAVAIVAGGSYWPHYLIELVPGTALAAGALAPLAARAWMGWVVGFVAGTSILGCVVLGAAYLAVPGVWFQERTGQWLAASGRPGDTAVVTYGNPSVLEAADMASPYPHLWSLPMRTLDPDQTRLRQTLEGPDAPTWLVQVHGLNTWRVDEDGRLRRLVQERYRVVAEVCGSPVLLRADLTRDLAPPPVC